MKHHVGIKELPLMGEWAAFCSCGWDVRPCSVGGAQQQAMEHNGGTLRTVEKARDRFNPLRVPRTGDDMTDEAFPGVK